MPTPPETSSAIVTIGNLSFRWPGSGFAIRVDHFAITTGERLLLIGPSGSGKSTFLALLCGIIAPQSGRIDILGRDLARMRAAERDRFRAEHIGVIFQMFNLLPYGSVTDNVVLPLAFARARARRVAEAGGAGAEATRLLERLGLGADVIASRHAARLSVGQQQRIAAARALIGRPELVVADEPTSALDRDRQIAFLDLLFEEVAGAGSTLVMVSHDETLSARFDRVVRLDSFLLSERNAA